MNSVGFGVVAQRAKGTNCARIWSFRMNSAAQGTQGTCNASSLLGCFEPFNETHGAHSQLSWHSVSLGQGLICGEAQAKQGGLQPLKNT